MNTKKIIFWLPDPSLLQTSTFWQRLDSKSIWTSRKKYQNLELEIEPWPKFYRNNLWTVEQFQSSHFLRNPSFGTYFESSPKTHISNMELTYHYQKPQSMNLHTINGTIVHTSKQDYYIKYICIRILGKSNNLHTGPSFSTLNSVYIRRNQSPHTHSLYLIVPS